MIDIDIIKEGGEILKECRKIVTEILGHEPRGDEIRLVNNLFLWVTKEIYFKSKEEEPKEKEEPATEKQLTLLNKLKIPHDKNITKKEASMLISRVIGEKK